MYYNICNHNEKSLKFLSNNLVKEACFYELGMIHIKNNRLAAFFFIQIKKKDDYWDDIVKECISKYYYYGRMFDVLEEFCEDRQFPLSYFFLGKLLEKDGKEKEALNYYKKARDIEQGEKNYQRLSKKITRDNESIYSSRDSYSPKHSGRSSGGCFITTATCLSLEKGENCYELTAFRNFRDNWLVYEVDGKKDIKKYYELAPKIVYNINLRKDSNYIYNGIWDKFSSKYLLLIETNKLNKVRYLYKKMVINLSKKYL